VSDQTYTISEVSDILSTMGVNISRQTTWSYYTKGLMHSPVNQGETGPGKESLFPEMAIFDAYASYHTLKQMRAKHENVRIARMTVYQIQDCKLFSSEAIVEDPVLKHLVWKMEFWAHLPVHWFLVKTWGQAVMGYQIDQEMKGNLVEIATSLTLMSQYTFFKPGWAHEDMKWTVYTDNIKRLFEKEEK